MTKLKKKHSLKSNRQHKKCPYSQNTSIVGEEANLNNQGDVATCCPVVVLQPTVSTRIC